ncbi:MAG: prefoldin subunit alpha [Theionarchaea archaeon]|nr:MAG: hypothetical protein AYK19_14410 [Theionarchaea archaeon DG-70-1]MBU7028813.1 prefoldin subunit alpha [Theionarchaea archaeon]
MTEEEMSEQELVINIQFLQDQAKMLASNIEMLSIYLQELATSKVTLEGIQTLKKGDEILVPIGASSFIRACIDDTERVIVGIGVNVSMNKTTEQALEELEERITFTQSKIRENDEKYRAVAARLEELSAKAQKILEKKGENV